MYGILRAVVEVVQTVEPAPTAVLMLLILFANGIYVQEHLNRAWDATAAPERVPIAPPLVPDRRLDGEDGSRSRGSR
jgi:hypothetical protein